MNGEQRFARVAQGLAACTLALAGLYAGDNADTFGHLAQGRQIVELGHVPQLDTWSLLPGPPRSWHNYEWLSDVLFFGMHSAFGYDGVLALKCLVLALTGWLAVQLAQQLGGSRAALFASALLIVNVPASRFRFTDRPHIFGLALSAVYLLMLARLCADPAPPRSVQQRCLGLLFGLHVLWVNLHGSHLLGVAMTFAFAALAPSTARKALLALLGLEAVASCVSPYGPHIVLDALAHVFDRRYSNVVTEWHSWSQDDPVWLRIGPALHAALLTLVSPLLWRRGRALRASLVVAALLALASYRSLRFVADFVLLTSPIAGVGLAQLCSNAPWRKLLGGLVLGHALAAALALWGAAQLPPYRGLGHGVIDTALPRGPGALLRRARRTPRVFASIIHSWPLMWEAPNARFFVDGRVPFYGPNHVAISILAFTRVELFDAILRKDEIDVVVLNHRWPNEARLLPSMMKRPGWSLVLVDDSLAMFARDDLAQTSNYPRFSLLQPRVGNDWVLAAVPTQEAALARELRLLAAYPSAAGYRAWALSVQQLAPLRRPRAQDGFRWPRDEPDWARYRQAAQLLRRSAETMADDGQVLSLRALVEATLCDLPAAEASLRAAIESAGVQREQMLIGLEIALRHGGRERVAETLRTASAHPESRGDGWLEELGRGSSEPPHCPAQPR